MSSSCSSEDSGVPGGSCAEDSNGKAPRRAAAAASQWAGTVLQSTKHSIQSWTVRKYTLPDKHVASQVLMYRQLLHTACRPNLTLSREYQGTPAQQAVLHMPWWSQGILESRKMIISYQNLLARLWVAGACTPYGESWQKYLVIHSDRNKPDEKKDTEDAERLHPEAEAETGDSTPERAKFRAPVPHPHWVQRLGFQQEDPVTDFRSGGILSLAMMVYLVESRPDTYRRFILDGDAAVLPFALTCINITDMMAKFLMLSKAVDRMDALLSQKPFWRMFADPNAMLVCQEIAMQLTAQVVLELQQERGPDQPVTVFDFANILQVVERRMEYDHLMAGPTSSDHLRRIHAKNVQKYQLQQQQRMRLMASKDDHDATGGRNLSEQTSPRSDEACATSSQQPGYAAWKDRVSGSMCSVGNMWQKVKAPGFSMVMPGAPTAPDLPSSTSYPPPGTISSATEPQKTLPTKNHGDEPLEDGVDILL